MPRLYDATAEAIDRRIGWDKLPLPLAMLVLIGLRNVLRRMRDLPGRAELTAQLERDDAPSRAASPPQRRHRKALPPQEGVGPA